jgi:hypothetical protein
MHPTPSARRRGVISAVESGEAASNFQQRDKARRLYRLKRRPTSQTSAFFFPDLTIDEIADIVAILFFENSIVGGFNLDIVVRRGRDLLLAGIGFLKRNQRRYRPCLAIILIGRGGAMGRARV